LSPKEPHVQKNEALNQNATKKIVMVEHEAPIANKMGEQALSLGIPRYREDRGPLRSTLTKND